MGGRLLADKKRA